MFLLIEYDIKRCIFAGVLEITAAVPSHAGRYTCSARNPAGVAHKHITLTVQGGLTETSCGNTTCWN